MSRGLTWVFAWVLLNVAFFGTLYQDQIAEIFAGPPPLLKALEVTGQGDMAQVVFHFEDGSSETLSYPLEDVVQELAWFDPERVSQKIEIKVDPGIPGYVDKSKEILKSWGIEADPAP